MDFIRIGDHVVHARRDGDVQSPPLVLVNACGTDLRVWERLTRYLAERFHVVRYDLRGHGLSPVAGKVTALQDLTTDLAGLLDQLDTGPAILVGHALGGRIALDLQHRRPDLVTSLVLLATTLRANDAPADPHQLVDHWFSPEFSRQRRDDVAGWQAMLALTPTEAYVAANATLAHSSAEAACHAVRVPTFVLAAEEDRLAPPVAVRELAERIAGARYEVIRHAGHLAPVEQPAAVAAAILSVVDRT
ncbi:MAG: alpha/beta fold hydrolase [Pseudomonadota bacterium]